MKLTGIGLRWWLLIVAVSLAVVAAWRWVPPSDNFMGIRIDFRTPSYRAIPQLHVAYLDLRSDLLLIEAGAEVPLEELSRHADVLASKINLLAQPSELSGRYGKIHGFKEGAAQLKAFSATVLPQLTSTAFSAESARSVLPAFNRLYPTILELSNNAWVQGSRDREEVLASINWQREVASGVMILLAAALAIVMIFLARYKRALGAA